MSAVDYWFEEAEIAAEKAGRKPEKSLTPPVVYQVDANGKVIPGTREELRRK